MDKFYSLDALIAARADWRSAGKKVVLTNGCYDLLHPGHVRLLEQAKSLGDVLILALEDANKRVAQCGFLLGRYPQMKILALAPEHNRGLFYWAVVDVRTKPLESSEAGILNALRERPSLVGAVHH